MANIYRRLLAEAIEKNGGYSRHYESWPLSWDVGLYASKESFNSLYGLARARLKEDWGVEQSNWTMAALTQVKLDWDHQMDSGELFNWILEDMRNSVTDGDTYCTYRPEIAARYGLPYTRFPRKYRKRVPGEGPYYPAGREGWVLEDPYTVESFEVEWEFAGRSGKHLVLTGFEGRKLERLTSEGLAGLLRGEEDGSCYTNAWCQRLLAMIHEWDLCFTSEAVTQEWEYQASYLLAQRLHDIHEQGDENELGLEALTEPSVVEGTVYITARLKGVEDPAEADEAIFTLDIDPERMPEQKALLLARIFKEAVEAHLAVHG